MQKRVTIVSKAEVKAARAHRVPSMTPVEKRCDAIRRRVVEIARGRMHMKLTLRAMCALEKTGAVINAIPPRSAAGVEPVSW